MSGRARLRRGRVAQLAARERVRHGIWFDQTGRICQRCPACRLPIRIPVPSDVDPDSDFDRYAEAVDTRLDEAVWHHLLLDYCPTPEGAL